jgi:hypothetical protein
VVHTISPEFKFIEPSIHWHRIMIRCTCEEVFSVIGLARGNLGLQAGEEALPKRSLSLVALGEEAR